MTDRLTIDLILALSEDELKARFTKQQLLDCIAEHEYALSDPIWVMTEISSDLTAEVAQPVEDE